MLDLYVIQNCMGVAVVITKAEFDISGVIQG